MIVLNDNLNYRACIVNRGNTTERGMFHCWTFDGGGIVEDEYGTCNVYPCSSIRFIKPIIENYVCDFLKEDLEEQYRMDKHYDNLMID